MKQVPKSQEETEFLTSFLKKSFLAKDLKAEKISQLISAMDRQTYKTGDIIIRYGDIGDKYFIMKRGKVTVFVYE